MDTYIVRSIDILKGDGVEVEYGQSNKFWQPKV